MPVTWSWSFGPETGAQLNNQMGWGCSTNANSVEPRTTYVYTYSGSAERYSLVTDPAEAVNLPANCFNPEGWVSIPIYMDTTGLSILGANTINIRGNSSGRNIYIQFDGSAAKLYVDNVLKEVTTSLNLFNQWNYFSLKYTMTGSDWGGQLYLNGSPVTAFQQDPQSAEIGGIISFAGKGNGDRVNYFGQVILHNSMADTGEVPRYVTRIQPTVDTSENGTWNPSSGSDNFKVLSGSFDASSFTRCAPSSNGNNVVCQSQNIGTQIGASITAIDGITIHTFSSGTGQDAFAALSDDNLTYAEGVTITPSLSTTSYAFATSGSQPSDNASWTISSNLFLKYEVS